MTLHNSKSKDKGFHVLSHIVCLDVRLNNISICHCFKMLQIFKKNCVLHIFNESGFFSMYFDHVFFSFNYGQILPITTPTQLCFPLQPPPKKKPLKQNQNKEAEEQ